MDYRLMTNPLQRWAEMLLLCADDWKEWATVSCFLSLGPTVQKKRAEMPTAGTRIRMMFLPPSCRSVDPKPHLPSLASSYSISFSISM